MTPQQENDFYAAADGQEPQGPPRHRSPRRRGRGYGPAEGDLITPRGLEAGAALARELESRVRVTYSTRHPAIGDWLNVEFVRPGNRS